MKKKYITRSIRVGVETQRVPRLFSKKTKVEDMDGYVSIKELDSSIEKLCNELDRDGYDVISIIPIIRGAFEKSSGSSWGWGYGYSVTEGVSITGKLRHE